MYNIHLITLMLIIFGKLLSADPVSAHQDKILTSNTTINVVTLEHRYTEMLLSLGITPSGVADISSYQKFDGVLSGKLNRSIDVGRRSLPSIVSIALLQPDIIIGANFRNIQAYKILNKIAPTMLFNYIDATGADNSNLKAMLNEFKTIAQMVNKSAQANIITSNFYKILNSDREKITTLKARKHLKNNRIAIAQFLPGSSKIRLFTTDSVSMEVITKLGLKPAWNISSGYSGMGYLTVSINTLQSLGKFHFFYFNERSDDSQLKKILSSNIWKSLEFVKSGMVHELNQDTWPWGGPSSVEKLMQQIINNLDIGNESVNT